MQKIFKHILALFYLSTFVLAQFRMDVPPQTIPSNLNGELDSKPTLSLFNPARFDLSHGFTMQMMNMGGQSVSMAGLTNKLTYHAMDNLTLDANVTLYKTTLPFQQQGALIDQLDIAYNAGLIYQPTKNSFLEFRIQNIPHYQRYQTYSPFNPRIIK